MSESDDAPSGLDVLFPNNGEEDGQEVADILEDPKADIMRDIGDMLGFEPANLDTPAFTKEEVAEIKAALIDAGYRYDG